MKPKRSSQKTKGWEVTPARLVLPAAPLPPTDAINDGAAAGSVQGKTLSLAGASTVAGSLDDARERAVFLLTECHRLVSEKNSAAFLKLLDQRPHLLVDPRVRAMLMELEGNNGLTRRRGRPAGRYALHPLVIVGWVQQLLATGAVKNREQAFAHLEEGGWIAYESAKDLFYQALKEERFRPVLFALPEATRGATQEEVAALHGAQTVLPGTPITRTATNADGESIQVTISAAPMK